MVVQHNLTAMNANRMLGLTSKIQSKTNEKLASGYRINRAADDAAGLSISEKMRKQMKGLDRSSMNAQDGVSSVQTAEGALAEVHSMLHRMNELSVQAANGTNSREDRDAIQAEIDQLSTEINRVAETTKFNETSLLKGEGPLTRHYPKAHDAGLVGLLTDKGTEASFEIPMFWPEDKVNIGGVPYTIGSSKEDAKPMIENVATEVDKYFNLATVANTDKVTQIDEMKNAWNQADAAAAQALVHNANAESYINQADALVPLDTQAKQDEYDRLMGLASDELELKRQWNETSTNYNTYANEVYNLANAYESFETDRESNVEAKTITIGNKTYKPEYTSKTIASFEREIQDEYNRIYANDPNRPSFDSYRKSYYRTNANQFFNESPTIEWIEKPSEDRINSGDFLERVIPVPSGVVVEYTTGSTATTGTEKVQDAMKDVKSLAGKAVDRANDATTQYTTADATVNVIMDKFSTTAGYQPPYLQGEGGLYAQLGDAYKELESKYADLVEEKKILVGDNTYTVEYTPDMVNRVTWTEYFSGRQTHDLELGEVPVRPSTRVVYESFKLNIMTDDEQDDFGKKVGDGVDDNNCTVITMRKAYEYIAKELTLANNIGTTAQESVVNFELTNKDIWDRVARFEIEKGYAEVNSALRFGLHVGSDADMSNKISLEIEPMNTANLGIDGINVSDERGQAATYAIDAISDALSIVSEQRSELGAIQNRLEHTIMNLDNVVENTTSAESRIRDTDMAKEMVEYAKNNILAQAGQAMLAQANQSTQGVLSLLQQ